MHTHTIVQTASDIIMAAVWVVSVYLAPRVINWARTKNSDPNSPEEKAELNMTKLQITLFGLISYGLMISIYYIPLVIHNTWIAVACILAAAALFCLGFPAFLAVALKMKLNSALSIFAATGGIFVAIMFPLHWAFIIFEKLLRICMG